MSTDHRIVEALAEAAKDPNVKQVEWRSGGTAWPFAVMVSVFVVCMTVFLCLVGAGVVDPALLGGM